MPALSAVVYRADGRLARSRSAPSISLGALAPAADRLEVGADVGGDGFNEVTFLAKAGRGGFKPIGTDDNRPYRVFHDVSGYEPGTKVHYKAVVLDNAGNARTTGARSTRVAEPSIALEAPDEGGKVRDEAEVRAVVTPDDADNVVTFQRRVGTGDWETIGSDSSSPVYTAFDDVSDLPTGHDDLLPGDRRLRRRHGDERGAQRHRRAAAADDGDRPLPALGRRLRRLGPAPVGRRDRRSRVTTAGTRRGCRRARSADGTVTFEIPLKDDTKPVNFIVHQPSGDSVPQTRDPGGDRSFVPIDHPEIWLKGGDATVYTTPQASRS